MVGVLTRLLTATKMGDGRYDVHMALNLVSWPPAVVGLIVKGVSVLLLGLLAVLLPDERPRGATIRGCSASSRWWC